MNFEICFKMKVESIDDAIYDAPFVEMVRQNDDQMMAEPDVLNCSQEIGSAPSQIDKYYLLHVLSKEHCL